MRGINCGGIGMFGFTLFVVVDVVVVEEVDDVTKNDKYSGLNVLDVVDVVDVVEVAGIVENGCIGVEVVDCCKMIGGSTEITGGPTMGPIGVTTEY